MTDGWHGVTSDIGITISDQNEFADPPEETTFLLTKEKLEQST